MQARITYDEVKDSNPLVSIITVVFNRKKTIARAIESVESQTYKNIEHIVIDGMSTDGTIEIIKSKKSIKQFICEGDRGIYDAINKGIKAANGSIIGLLHSDDLYYDKSVVNEAVKIISGNGFDGVYGDVYYFESRDVNKFIRIFKSNKFNHKDLKKGLMPAHPTVFLKKDVFKVYGQYKIDYKIAGDFEFIARIFNNNNKLKIIYNKNIRIRMQIGGISTSGIRGAIIKAQELRRACKENDIKTNWFLLASRYFYKIQELIT